MRRWTKQNGWDLTIRWVGNNNSNRHNMYHILYHGHSTLHCRRSMVLPGGDLIGGVSAQSFVVTPWFCQEMTSLDSRQWLWLRSRCSLVLPRALDISLCDFPQATSSYRFVNGASSQRTRTSVFMTICRYRDIEIHIHMHLSHTYAKAFRGNARRRHARNSC